MLCRLLCVGGIRENPGRLAKSQAGWCGSCAVLRACWWGANLVRCFAVFGRCLVGGQLAFGAAGSAGGQLTGSRRVKLRNLVGCCDLVREIGVSQLDCVQPVCLRGVLVGGLLVFFYIVAVSVTTAGGQHLLVAGELSCETLNGASWQPTIRRQVILKTTYEHCSLFSVGLLLKHLPS